MNITVVAYHNFLAFADAAADLTSVNGAILLLGKTGNESGESNGAGKSSFIEGIVWCLWGESRAKSDDDIIRHGAKEMSVKVIFELNGIEYVVVRKRSKGKKTELSFNAGQKVLTENSIKATQEVINRVVMPYDLYLNTGYFKQKEADVFAKQTPKNRKQVLMDILPLQMYAKAYEQASEYYTVLDRDAHAKDMSLQDLIAQVNINEKEIIEEDVEDLKKNVDTTAAKIKSLSQELTDTNDKYSRIQEQAKLFVSLNDDIAYVSNELERTDNLIKTNNDKKKNEAADIQNDIDGLKKRVGDRGKIETILKDISGEYDKLLSTRSEIAKLNEERKGIIDKGMMMKRNVSLINEDVDKLRGKYKTLSELEGKAKCPLCASELDAEKTNKVLIEIELEGKGKSSQIEEIEAEITKLGGRGRDLDLQIRQFTTENQKTNELENDKKKYEAQLIDLDIAQNRIVYQEEQLKKLDDKYKAFEIEYKANKKRAEEREKELKKKLKELEYDKDAVDSLQSKIRSVGEDMKVQEQMLSTMRTQLGVYQERQKAMETLKKNIEINKKRLEELREEGLVYYHLTKAFGRDGIPALILENAIPEIEAEANSLLCRLSSGMRISLATQRELKSGDMAETLDIIISDEQGSRPYELYSGGEQMRVNMAIRLALSKILCRRSGTKIETIIIDEVDSLDEDGMRQFVGIINEMGKIFKKIIVVTHINELKDYFNRVITVQKTKEGSKIII